jgi:hypothetical protein
MFPLAKRQQQGWVWAHRVQGPAAPLPASLVPCRPAPAAVEHRRELGGFMTDAHRTLMGRQQQRLLSDGWQNVSRCK